MRTFLVRLERYNTPELIDGKEDFVFQTEDKTVLGAYSVKNILVRCDSKEDVANEVEIFKAKKKENKGFKATHVQDWNALRQAQVVANVQWIMDR